jgi:2-haloacid dehalogenase
MTATRRQAMRLGAAALAASGLVKTHRAYSQETNMADVKALVFDIFGTVVDWRGGVAREAERILKPLGHTLDWFAFAEAWRKLYGSSMEQVRSGKRAFVKLDILHRESLETIRTQFKLPKLEESTLAELNLAWHKLEAWPDVGPAFARLHKKFLMAPCSNGNIAMMANMARHNDLQWDAILGAEIAQDYKPKASVYLKSCEALNLNPAQVMMCAAHSGDLAAAQKLGMRTGHIARPNEGGPGVGETQPKGSFDIAAKDFNDFAEKLGA